MDWDSSRQIPVPFLSIITISPVLSPALSSLLAGPCAPTLPPFPRDPKPRCEPSFPSPCGPFQHPCATSFPIPSCQPPIPRNTFHPELPVATSGRDSHTWFTQTFLFSTAMCLFQPQPGNNLLTCVLPDTSTPFIGDPKVGSDTSLMSPFVCLSK